MRTAMAVMLGLVTTACFTVKKNSSLLVKTFDKQGHRGCRGLMPENTIAAMLKAIDLDVTTLETDVVITKDKQVILSHEPFFSHEITTRPNGTTVKAEEEKGLNIYQMSYDEVKQYDVGLRSVARFPLQLKTKAVKPLLAAMIDSVEAYCTSRKKALPQYNIETKSHPDTDNRYHPAPAEFVELLVAVIKEKRMTDRVTIQSFDIRTLQYLHRHYPSFKTALLVADNDKKIFALQLQSLGFIPTVYSPHYVLVTPLLVKQCKDAGISLVPWTVNDLPKMKELKQLGVDGIITDYPNLFAELQRND